VLVEVIVAALLGAFGSAALLTVGRQLGKEPGLGMHLDLNASGEQIKRVIRRTLRKEERERPRVLVSGPKVRPVVCQICLGRVKEGLEYARCSCGKVFHPVCLVRTGTCPYCGAVYSEGSLGEEHMVRPKQPEMRKPPGISLTWQGDTDHLCPICGAELPEGSGECACGAVIVEEGQEFDCPSCGTRVPADQNACPLCHERFDLISSRTCEVCGAAMSEDALVCNCGALIGERCPECGSPLESDDLFCARCGAAFEFV